MYCIYMEDSASEGIKTELLGYADRKILAKSVIFELYENRSIFYDFLKCKDSYLKRVGNDPLRAFGDAQKLRMAKLLGWIEDNGQQLHPVLKKLIFKTPLATYSYVTFHFKSLYRIESLD